MIGMFRSALQTAWQPLSSQVQVLSGQYQPSQWPVCLPSILVRSANLQGIAPSEGMIVSEATLKIGVFVEP